MTADYQTGILMKGTQEELLALLGVLQAYEAKKDGVYIYSETIQAGEASKRHGLFSLEKDAENIKKLIADSGNALYFTASGPFGRFGYLEELTIFEEMAAAAPHAYIKGEISGYNSYSNQSAEAELSDELLRLSYYLINDDDDWDGDDEDENEDEDEDEDEDEVSIQRVQEKTYDPIAQKYVGETKEYFREV